MTRHTRTPAAAGLVAGPERRVTENRAAAARLMPPR